MMDLIEQNRRICKGVREKGRFLLQKMRSRRIICVWKRMYIAFWNRQQSNDATPYWRDANGAIVCKGDNYVIEECGDDCPIRLGTQGITFAKLIEYDKAIEAYEQALRIAPDFVNAWNNMAAFYGLTGKYERARAAYKKAYEPGHSANALYGLALANRDCGNKEEALRCCEDYRAKFPDEAIN